MNRPVFSFIVPTRHRTDQLRRLLDSITATTRHPDQLEVILVVDQDDEESAGFRYDGLRLKHVLVEPGLAMGALNMSGYRAAEGRYLQLLNDDVLLRTPGWDEQVRAAFHSFPDAMVLVHVNDLLFRESLSTFPFLTREFCSLTGGICPEGYLRYCIDDHIHNIFDLLGLLGRQRRLYLPDVIFEHTNVQATPAGGREYVSDPAIQQRDKQLFDALFEARKKIAVEVMQYIEGRLQAETPLVWEKTLEAITDSAATRWRVPARSFPPAPPVSEEQPRVTIGILSADLKSARARKGVELVRAYTSNFQLLLIDNNGDSTLNRARERNRLLSACRTDYLVLLDAEVWVQPGWLEGLLRALTPEAGVVTPVHHDPQGHLCYAGIVLCPDDSGQHSPLLATPSEPRRIQTLCGACLLIDLPKIGHLRLEESGADDFASLDYGLRVWEEGFQVVCSPYSVVTSFAGTGGSPGADLPAPLPEEQPQRYLRSWVKSGRIERLRRGAWKDLPEISWVGEQAARIDQLIEAGGTQQRHEFVGHATELVRGLTGYPVLQEYILRRSRAELHGNVPRADDPNIGHLAILLGLAGEPILFEEGFEGMNIVLQNFTYYALPQGEGAFSRERMAQGAYSRGLEASTVEAVKALICGERGAAPAGINRPAPPARARPIARAPRSPETMRETGASYSNPLAHFLSVGGYEGRRPNPLFDPAYYLAENPEVAAAGTNPLAHFIELGAREGRRPNPLFDLAYYRQQNPDVAAAGINPLEHFLEIGAAQARKPNPLFDTAYYLAQNPDVAAAGINPLAHFLDVGAQEGRRPNPLFDTAYYRQQNPEVAEAGINPLAHFLEYGALQGRRPHPLFDTARYLQQHPEVAQQRVNPLAHFLEHGETAAPHDSHLTSGDGEPFSRGGWAADGLEDVPLVPLAVVIPTRNRSSWLVQTLEACSQQAGGCELDIIVIDDGSTDDTRRRLSELSGTMPNLTWRSTAKRGLAHARNLGADAARRDVILFLSDEVRPCHPDFFRVHAFWHSRCADENLAVLGEVGWSCRGSGDTSGTVVRLEGPGGVLCPSYPLRRQSLAGWPHFSTANVSVKKALARDWLLEGFDADFGGAPDEDLEFAYRLSQNTKGFWIFYDPASSAARHEPFTLAAAMEQESGAGQALAHWVELHPELAARGQLQEFLGALNTSGTVPPDHLACDYRLMMEGVTAWATALESKGEMGTAAWHEDFLAAVLELCRLEGFLSAWPAPGNLTAARALLVNHFRRRLHQSPHPELAGGRGLMPPGDLRLLAPAASQV